MINEKRGRTVDGHKIYTLEDIYPFADLVTYPSTFEGFGNAFLEAVYFRKPIMVNTYSIYQMDIQPKGFNVIRMDGYVTEETVQHTRRVLDDPSLCREMVERNYAIARKCYSYKVLERKLGGLIEDSIACWV
jgi:glycosyltransferase involved in cell wall biosynthesis